MNKIFNFLSDLVMSKHDDGIKIGLTQFKTQEFAPARKKDVSIRTKDVKLSDLMRRAS